MIMHPFEYDTLQSIKKHGLLKKGDQVVIGVSGGSDSMALLRVLAALAGELDLSLLAVYVDHGLRPVETLAEAALVEEQADELGVKFETGAIPVREHAEEQGLSIEMAARELRYGFLLEVRMGGAKIAVAHTADDQAEELLLRLLRGTGRNGLSGMSPTNYLGVVRPFLDFSKERLLEYLKDKNVFYLEDSSNTDRGYLRNRVRLDLLPFLEKEFNPAIRETLLRTAEILGREDEVLKKLAADAYQKTVQETTAQEGLSIGIGELLSEEMAIRRRIVEQALVKLGAPVSFQQVEKILELAAIGEPGAELHLAEGLRVVKKSAELELSYPAGRVRQRGSLKPEKEDSFMLTIDGPGTWDMKQPGIRLNIEVLAEIPSKAEISEGEADYLDLAGASFPLTVRSFKPGDRFYPLGAPGSRKVADFLADRKIPREERWQVPVVESGGRILALPGLRIDHSCRLKDTTVKVLKIEIEPL